VGERAAIDDLGTAVVTVDDAGRVVDLNREAERVLGTDQAAVLGAVPPAPLGDVDPAAPEGPVSTTVDGERREYAVTASPVRGASGVVGHTVVLQDVTEARRREQRLAVLNRVLRHNLRNDLNVVQGYLDTAAGRVDDDEVDDLLAAAEASAIDLMELGEKAREIERAMGARDRRHPVAVRELLDATAADLRADGPAGTVRIDVPDDIRVRANELLLRGVFENLVENGLEHSDSEAPVVEVTFGGLDGDRATFRVRDDGPGIPDHELDALAAEEETALEHGSGLGLWFVAWAAAALGGEVTFDTDPGGTTAVVTLPDASRDPGADR
jgi:signal transduction histidine kinase